MAEEVRNALWPSGNGGRGCVVVAVVVLSTATSVNRRQY